MATRWAKTIGWRQAIGFFGRANGAIFVAVGVLHQDCADEIRAQLPRQVATGQPFALEVTADLWALSIDPAAAASAAIDALGPRRAS